MNALAPSMHVVVAVAHRLGGEVGGVGAGARFGQAVTAELLHGDEGRQEPMALGIAAERVDHPRHHVVDRQIGGGGRAALGEFFEDECRVEPSQAGAADIVAHIDGGETQRRRLAQGLDRKDFAFVPGRAHAR